MAAKLRMILRLFRFYGRMDLLWVLRDTKYCLIYIFSDLVSCGAAVAGVFLLSVQFDGFLGLTKEAVFFMLAYGVVVDGIYMLFCTSSNNGQVSRIIARGQLDHSLIQPIPLWMDLLTCGFAPFSGSSRLICGATLMGYCLQKLAQPVGVWWLFCLGISLAGSVIIYVSAIYIVSCLAFYVPAAAEEIAGNVVSLFGDLKSYPLGGLSGLWRTVFCTLVPIGGAAWLPSLGLLRQLENGKMAKECLATAGIAAVCMTIAVILFKKGLYHYATYGSPRYSSLGHR